MILGVLTSIATGWLLCGFIAARVFWIFYNRGRISGIEPIPFITTIFMTLLGPTSFIGVYIHIHSKNYEERG